MSSSDSDDNIYGNVGKKLLKIRREFKIQKLQNEKLAKTTSLNDSFLDEIMENSKNIAGNKAETDSTTRKTRRKATGKPSKRGRTSKKSESSVDSDNSLVNDVIFVTSCSTRTTRSNSKRSDDTDLSTSPDRSKGRGKSRGRGTSRGKAKRGRGQGSTGNDNQELSIFSIGNTDEYPDELEDVKLFSSKQNTSNNDVIVIDDTVAEENEELSVKVYWQSVDVYKFKIRKYQKLTQIYEHFSKQENVTIDKLLFTYNNTILKPDDSPDTINYNIAKFIDGGIVYNSNVTMLPTKKNVKNSGIKIKFQFSKSKRPFEVYIERNDKLALAMTKCAEHLEVPLKNLKFEFDGDIITGNQTLGDLDMEGDECIDVKIIR